MRFYVPEWEDHVDAEYDFENDEHSAIHRSERNLAYIWDIFNQDPERTPIDGVLISREQIEDSPSRARRLREYGVYDAPNDGTTLEMPSWLPTISDCGAWGYKALPFPPYGNAEMLDFYEQLNVGVGVTIDHLVLGSGHTSRLYIDERALGEHLEKDDIPDAITQTVDVMIDEWPEEWPENVNEYESSIFDAGEPKPLPADIFDVDVEGLDPEKHRDEIAYRVEEKLTDIADDPRLVYRDDDMTFRYELTLDNLREMQTLYEAGDYSFRLMSAIQGWDTSSYSNATRVALSEGYQYIGIGGIAGSPESDVKQYVSAVGNVIKDFERANGTRVDTHVFGFAKTGAFETIGRSGMTSFDSASMLRAAWTGGSNYHLKNDSIDDRYDALRVRYPNHRMSMEKAIDTALWSQEVLSALRAYDDNAPTDEAVEQWYDAASKPLEELEPYLREHRWDDLYDTERIRETTEVFRTDFALGRKLKANFSDRFRKQIVKLLRKDSEESPVPFEEYTELIELAKERLETFPRTLDTMQQGFQHTGDSFSDIWRVIEAYTDWIGDEEMRDAYRKLLEERPWEQCDCEVCTDIGIEVAIFRGNNRNRRRGFHNTRNFYDQMEEELPKLLLITKGSVGLSQAESIEEFLASERPDFWEAVHDLPVAEIGAVSAEGVHEWWAESPKTVSLEPKALEQALASHCKSYQEVYAFTADWTIPETLADALAEVSCELKTFEEADVLRDEILERLSYSEHGIPPHPKRQDINQAGISEF